jgi:hypothetical protein
VVAEPKLQILNLETSYSELCPSLSDHTLVSTF